jgi:ADP-ribose pyrophosphatase
MLKPPPEIVIRALAEESTAGPGFLGLERRRCVVDDPVCDQEFTYDTVWRCNPDVAVIVAHFVRDRQLMVYLRSCVRPPLSFRQAREPSFAPLWQANLWELPAGLIEERGDFERSARRCAARELHEEVGFAVDPSRFGVLGPSVYPAPAMIAERQVFLEVAVDPSQRRPPAEDGSALERGGAVLEIALDAALDACRKGLLQDSKTELGLRRFAELQSGPSR